MVVAVLLSALVVVIWALDFLSLLEEAAAGVTKTISYNRLTCDDCTAPALVRVEN